MLLSANIIIYLPNKFYKGELSWSQSAFLSFCTVMFTTSGHIRTSCIYINLHDICSVNRLCRLVWPCRLIMVATGKQWVKKR